MLFFQLLAPKRKRLFWTSYSISILLVALIGVLGGLLFGYAIDLPQVEQLQEVRPNIVSYVYSEDGRVLGQFALEKRVLVSYDQIPENLMNAILSTEDASFFEHSGIDFRRLFVTVIRDIILGERKGASTLTMQLSKLLFTSTEKTIERKILRRFEFYRVPPQTSLSDLRCSENPLGFRLISVPFFYPRRFGVLILVKSLWGCEKWLLHKILKRYSDPKKISTFFLSSKKIFFRRWKNIFSKNSKILW